MKQNSLFDADDGALAVPGVGIPGSQPALGKQQKLFNKLIAEIEARRATLQAWRDFQPVYRKHCSDEIEPLHRRLREARVAMVALLDRAMDGGQLGKRQRDKVRDILLGQLSELLGEADDAELETLYEKYSDVARESGAQMEIVQELASRMFGIEIDEAQGTLSPEELEALITAKLSAGQRDVPPPGAPGGRKKSKKAAAAEATRERAELDASQAIREVYRKLVSELHPDREPDAAERERKTVLMQQVNQAYDARDLLGLLQVQLSIEQIDPAALAGMAEDRLTHYNLVLKEQLQRLDQEQGELTLPFLTIMGLGPRSRLMPDDVLQSIAAEARAIKSDLKRLKADLAHYRDIVNLKASLKHYRVARSAADDDIDQLVEMMQGPPPRGRRRR